VADITTIPGGILLSDEQQAAYDRVRDFVRRRPRRTYTLFGYAGTGKTTLCASSRGNTRTRCCAP
jgi:hypothetical protein